MSAEVINDRSELPEYGFTIVANSLARDSRLRRVTRSLMIEIMSHADNFVVTEALLVNNGLEGRDVVRNSLKELERFGYLERVRIREGGKFGSVRYRPIRRAAGGLPPLPENQSVVEENDVHRVGKQVTGNPTLKKTKEEDQKDMLPLASSGQRRHPDPTPQPEEKPRPKPKPKAKTVAVAKKPDPVIEKLCEELADWVEKNTGRRPQIPEAWRVDCRRMIEIDGRTPEQIRGAINWSQKDPFWCANIMSMKKLREKYDTLLLQATNRRTAGAGGKSTAERIAGGSALIAKFAAMDAAEAQQRLGSGAAADQLQIGSLL